ncbi:cytochrome P460 family protein [Rhodoferax sp. U11-2br]|uniref:cytochrome P460 family protein n=1 Tax=Rhodoferax sp. U11-2br TaxID=2838878 RepID=UPI001BE6E129|nr:cytochrome P460 family protein [Rhodoferax sp. U11-2br]MBT3068086.1 cytochrome P460 family protein [Rhodoferax sp. U11-2br]
MKVPYRRVVMRTLTFWTLTLTAGWVIAESNRVTFPTALDQLVHYATVKRGQSTEHMLTSQAAIDAVKKGQPVPNGTHVVLVDYRDAKVFRYFVMEKGSNWGADYEPKRRTHDWQFQAFKPDRTINLSENSARCQSCHQSQETEQYLYTLNDLRQSK